MRKQFRSSLFAEQSVSSLDGFIFDPSPNLFDPRVSDGMHLVPLALAFHRCEAYGMVVGGVEHVEPVDLRVLHVFWYPLWGIYLQSATLASLL